MSEQVMQVSGNNRSWQRRVADEQPSLPWW